MSVYEALIAFAAAAALLTLTPGLDTALVLRTAAVEGPKRAALAGLGIGMGCLIWGAAVAFGLGAVLSASQLAFVVLRWAGKWRGRGGWTAGWARSALTRLTLPTAPAS